MWFKNLYEKYENSFITTISNPQIEKHFIQSVTPVIMAHASNKLLITLIHTLVFFFLYNGFFF